MDFDGLMEIVKGGGARICADSRVVGAGDVFVAVCGPERDGHDFVGQAVARGARYVVCEREVECGKAGRVIVADSTLAAAELSQAAAGWPARQLVNLAVTGTNGKTTTAFLVKTVIEAAGGKCGLVGTIVCDTGARRFEAKQTTPGCVEMAALQAEMVRSGAGYMVIEASSHAMHQGRLRGMEFTAAAFTNLSGEHLDYHKTKGDYLAAKAILFRGLSGRATAVLNAESREARQIAKETTAKVLWYGIERDADLAADIESMDTRGTRFMLSYEGKKAKVATNLLGRYNISNMLAAGGLCLAAGFGLEQVAAGLGNLECVPGRLERVEAGQDFAVLVDYAHTDDALKNVLGTLKPLCDGRLIVVFGCGGDRDRTKRPRMAQVAEQFGDKVFVTSDNPRTEDAAAIIDEVMTGFARPRQVVVEADRRNAIQMAIEEARKADVLLIAGKGHENYQIIGKERIHFSDKETALEFLGKKR